MNKMTNFLTQLSKKSQRLLMKILRNLLKKCLNSKKPEKMKISFLKLHQNLRSLSLKK